MEKNYANEENIAVVFVAFCGGMEFISPGTEYNRSCSGRDIGSGIDDCWNCSYYDGCRRAGWYSVCNSWFTADYTEYFLRVGFTKWGLVLMFCP